MTRTETEWQARERELLEANNRLLERARKAEAKTLLWQQQATSATPGGSEYCDPLYCGEFLRQSRQELVHAKLDRARLVKALDDIDAQNEVNKERARTEHPKESPMPPLFETLAGHISAMIAEARASLTRREQS